ncbi:LysR substrate-binding domain-containing protein [Leifsonia sp. A12D58]|uniref:LysR substrate-binding domain-containing protein n=1 Tax=Leifsonia sp. A12D58 TaxID=3397674 RepID=UPI0039DF9C6A
MADFTLRQLAYFVGIADAGSVSEAANQLHVSASALSNALTELETSLGTQLCIRRKAHGVTLTPSGLTALTQARQVLRAANEIRLAASCPDQGLHGTVSLGCYLSLAPTVVPPILEALGTMHPGITLRLVESTQDDLQRDLTAGELDLAAVYDMRLTGRHNRALLYEVTMHVLLPANHPLAGADAVDPTELMHEPFILLDAPPSSEFTLGMLESLGHRPLIAHRTASYEMVRSLVARGLGWSVLVQRPANPVSYEGLPVVVKEITPAIPPIGVYLIWPEKFALTPRAQAVVDCALDQKWPRGQ